MGFQPYHFSNDRIISIKGESEGPGKMACISQCVGMKFSIVSCSNDIEQLNSNLYTQISQKSLTKPKF